MPLERPFHALPDLADAALAVDLDRDPPLPVEVEDRVGALVEHLGTAPGGLLGVVVAVHEARLVDVAEPVVPGRVVDHVVAARALRADQAAGQPPDQLLELDVQVEQAVDPLADGLQHAVQGLRLRHRAGEAVEQEASAAIGAGDPLPDHVDHHLVGHQLAAVHVLLGLHPQLGSSLDVVPEDVAGRDLRDAVVPGEEVGLCPLATAGRPEEQQVHLMNPRY